MESKLEKEDNPLRQRLLKAINWLINRGLCNSYADFGIKISHSDSFVKNFNATKVSRKTIGAISRTFPMINVDWIVTGEGELFLEVEEEIVVPEPTPSSAPVSDTKTLEDKVEILFSQVASLLRQNELLQEKIKALEGKNRAKI